MEAGQPAETNGIGIEAEGLLEALGVVQEIAVADHDPLGVAGGARSVLKKGKTVRGESRLPPAIGGVGEYVSRQPETNGPRVALLQAPTDVTQQRIDAENGPGGSITEDRLEPTERAVGLGWISRDSDSTGIEAAEKGLDEVQPRRIEQQDRPACQTGLLKGRGDSAGAAVELGRGQDTFRSLPISQERL